MSTQPIDRTDWSTVRMAFVEFFGDRGEVDVDDERMAFRAAITGFTIGADGSSESFMPLHTARLGWDTIVFDHDAHDVRLEGPGGSYVYVLPPDLR